jgi:hypothetical protein
VNDEVIGGRFGRILGGAGKKKAGVLQGEGEYLRIKIQVIEFTGQSLIEGSEATPQGPGRTDDDYFLQIAAFSGGFECCKVTETWLNGEMKLTVMDYQPDFSSIW